MTYFLKLFKASTPAPKSHEEFMNVIKANMVKRLRCAGDEYFYDPQKEELFVLKRQ